MKRKRASSKNDENLVQIGELSFEKRHAGADYITIYVANQI